MLLSTLNSGKGQEDLLLKLMWNKRFDTVKEFSLSKQKPPKSMHRHRALTFWYVQVIERKQCPHLTYKYKTRRQSCNGKFHLNGISHCSKSFITSPRNKHFSSTLSSCIWLIMNLEGKPNVIACWECRSFTYSSSTFVCQTKTLLKFHMVVWFSNMLCYQCKCHI